jgi:biopolymer transport protein ExbB/TolQ
MLKNKKAQVGETITWIIATIVLIAILMIFIFTSLALSKLKLFKVNLKTDSVERINWIGEKTEMAYSLNSENKNRIQLWISKEGEYNEE